VNYLWLKFKGFKLKKCVTILSWGKLGGLKFEPTEYFLRLYLSKQHQKIYNLLYSLQTGLQFSLQFGLQFGLQKDLHNYGLFCISNVLLYYHRKNLGGFKFDFTEHLPHFRTYTFKYIAVSPKKWMLQFRPCAPTAHKGVKTANEWLWAWKLLY